MTLDELIQKLQHLREEKGGSVPVLVTGFDSSGFDDLEQIDTVTVKRLYVKTSHGPAYEEPDRPFCHFTGPEVTALHLA